MANKINLMGSEVLKGYACKPVKLDPNKPIMHYKTIIYICEDERCSSYKKNQAIYLREILKGLGLDSGKNRIKISRSFCQGACRYKQIAQINENTMTNGFLPNNGIWLSKTHKYSKNDWVELFLCLKNNQQLPKKFTLINQKIF